MSQIADKLKQIQRFSHLNGEREHAPRHRKTIQRFPDINSYRGDGIDHINVGNTAKTELGRLLSNNYIHGFNHPVLGGFKSIEGYWNYLKTNDDRFRYATKNIKNLSQAIKGKNLRGFRFLILEGVYCKLKSLRNQLIEKLEAHKGLPFDIYYERNVGQGEGSNSYILIRVPYFEWYLNGLSEVISAVVENREPNLNRYMDRMTRDEIYSQFVRTQEVPRKETLEQPEEKLQTELELEPAQDTPIDALPTPPETVQIVQAQQA